MRCGDSQTVPDSVLPNLVPSAFGDQRVDHAVGRAAAAHLADQLDAGGDVAPLVAAAGLQLAAFLVVQVEKVVGLQQHVAELGEGDAFFAVDAVAHRVLGDHVVDGEMLAGIAQEIDQRQRHQPVGVVHHPGRVAFDFEIEEVGQLFLDRLDVGLDLLARQQLALVGLSARVADHAGPAASQGNGMVPKALQARQRNQRDQVADMQAVGGGVEAVIDGDLFSLQQGINAFEAVVYQPAPF